MLSILRMVRAVRRSLWVCITLLMVAPGTIGIPATLRLLRSAWRKSYALRNTLRIELLMAGKLKVMLVALRKLTLICWSITLEY